MTVFVYGTGAWGTALALSALKAKQSTTLISRRPEFAQELQENRVNKRYLPNISLPADLAITGDISVLKDQEGILLLVSPAQVTAQTLQSLKPFLPPKMPVVLCAKGIDLKSLQLLSSVAKATIDNPIAVLSGPSFAKELAQNLPTAVTIACRDIELAKKISEQLRHACFRCYASDDIIGAQVGGALKNVLAIACGIVRGRQLGENAAAALLCRGIAEMQRFGYAMGAHKETFQGLSGTGDLILTGSSQQSRNFSLGFSLGAGKTLEEILGSRYTVTEGIATAAAVMQLAETLGVRIPLCQAVFKILHENQDISMVIESILTQQADHEF